MFGSMKRYKNYNVLFIMLLYKDRQSYHNSCHLQQNLYDFFPHHSEFFWINTILLLVIPILFSVNPKRIDRKFRQVIFMSISFMKWMNCFLVMRAHFIKKNNTTSKITFVSNFFLCNKNIFLLFKWSAYCSY